MSLALHDRSGQPVSFLISIFIGLIVVSLGWFFIFFFVVIFGLLFLWVFVWLCAGKV